MGRTTGSKIDGIQLRRSQVPSPSKGVPPCQVEVLEVEVVLSFAEIAITIINAQHQLALDTSAIWIWFAVLLHRQSGTSRSLLRYSTNGVNFYEQNRKFDEDVSTNFRAGGQ